MLQVSEIHFVSWLENTAKKTPEKRFKLTTKKRVKVTTRERSKLTP